ncbi:MAG: MTAP family purine nucleoside phosphorylase, partial [Candidatus Heimdallarchaeota archaeon]|nr:MTAP family purine nucleoside phosphorylase [Candidatus Heimdallarchaeota archaeon]
FGDTTVEVGKLEGKDVCFIPRHGSGHETPPHAINYRANIFAAQLLKTERIFSTNAVGSSNLDVGSGSFVVLDQIFDMTNGRSTTFFDGQDFKVTTIKGATLSGVVHTDVSEPFDSNIRQTLINSCKYLDEKVVETGIIGVFNGPRYETPAEISAFTKLGVNYFGMTSAPEAFLAKEIQIPYATLALVTNFASGLQSKVTHDEVTDLFEKRIEVIKKVIRHAIISS